MASSKIQSLKTTIWLLLITTGLTAEAQKIQSGIYAIDYTTDTTTVNTWLEKYNKQPDPQNDLLKNIYQYKYHQLIDSAYQIRYVLVINNSSSANKDSFPLLANKDSSPLQADKDNSLLQMIWLNGSIPKNYNVSYSDSLKRKFIGMELSIGRLPQSWNEMRYSGDDGFLNYADLDRFSENDTYKYQYDPGNLYITDQLFILKSHRFELIRDSVKADSSTYYSEPLFGSGYRKATNYLTYKQGLTILKLKEAVKYQSFIHLKNKVKFYTNPTDKTDYQPLVSGDFIALIKETDEWYFGEHISADGKRQAGRIFIDDLSAVTVKTQKVNGMDLKIRYAVNAGQESYNDRGTIESIKVYKDKKLIQVIKQPGLISDTTQLVHFADANFDGYPDLEIYSHDGGAGPNYGNNYYLYNPKTNKFEYNARMSDLSQPAINTKTRSITAAWRNGAANHGFEKYKWINRKLVQVEYYETLYRQDDKIEETHGILVNGKMKNKVRILKDESGLKFPSSVIK